MNRIMAYIFILYVACFSLFAQQPLSGLFRNDGDITLRGRIVLYDWASHETTSGDDFVVKTMDPNVPYARVIYKPFWGFDAPPAMPKDRLDRLAFVGRGASWSFNVQRPQSVEEKAACSSRIVNHKYEDESGSGEIPRFVPTPGANAEKVPSLQSLPCFILMRGGLARAKSDKGALKSVRLGSMKGNVKRMFFPETEQEPHSRIQLLSPWSLHPDGSFMGRTLVESAHATR